MGLPWGFLRPPEWRMRGERVGSGEGELEGLARGAGGPGWRRENANAPGQVSELVNAEEPGVVPGSSLGNGMVKGMVK